MLPDATASTLDSRCFRDTTRVEGTARSVCSIEWRSRLCFRDTTRVEGTASYRGERLSVNRFAECFRDTTRVEGTARFRFAQTEWSRSIAFQRYDPS